MKFEIVNRKQLTADIFSVEVLAPNVARHALPGHFVIVIVKQGGERIPLTIADYDRKKGTILLVVQVVVSVALVQYLLGRYPHMLL